jgi:hypothetical protein
MPRVRLVHAFRATDQPARELLRIDLANEVLIERADQDIVEAWLGNSGAESRNADFARIASDRPGNVIIELSASAPAILVLNESYQRGWKATQSGPEPAQSGRSQEPRALRINGDFLGFLVPPGRRTVEFRFAPTSLRYGRLFSVCGLGLLVICCVASVWPRVRPSPST